MAGCHLVYIHSVGCHRALRGGKHQWDEMELLCAQTKWFETYALLIECRNRNWWSAKVNRRRLFPKNVIKLQIKATCKNEREARRMQSAAVTHPRYVPAHEEAASARDALGVCCRGKRQSPTCSTPRVTARRDDTHTGQLWRTKSSHRTPTSRRRNSCSPTCWELLLCFFLNSILYCVTVGMDITIKVDKSFFWEAT